MIHALCSLRLCRFEYWRDSFKTLLMILLPYFCLWVAVSSSISFSAVLSRSQYLSPLPGSNLLFTMTLVISVFNFLSIIPILISLTSFSDPPAFHSQREHLLSIIPQTIPLIHHLATCIHQFFSYFTERASSSYVSTASYTSSVQIGICRPIPQPRGPSPINLPTASITFPTYVSLQLINSFIPPTPFSSPRFISPY